MTITPTFHFVCRYCGLFITVCGKCVELPEGFYEVNGRYMEQARDAAMEAAGCLDDTCKACMPAHYKQAAQEQDFQAEKDLS